MGASLRLLTNLFRTADGSLIRIVDALVGVFLLPSFVFVCKVVFGGGIVYQPPGGVYVAVPWVQAIPHVRCIYDFVALERLGDMMPGVY